MTRKTDYLLDSPVVSRYLGRLSPSSHQNALYTIHYFIEYYQEHSHRFNEYSIDELIEFHKRADNSDRYEALDLLIDWIQSMKLRHSTLKQRYTQIRGLFKSNRAELPSEKINYQPDRPKVKSRLTVDKLRQIALKSNTMYRAAFLCMFMGGMGRDEFIRWSDTGYAKLVKDLRNNPAYIIVPHIGRKMQKYVKDYYTIIAGDALQALGKYLRERGTGDGAIFLNQKGDPLKKRAIYIYWFRKVKQLGYYESQSSPRARTGMGLHEVRDLFRSQWEKSSSKGSVAEFLMQHDVDPNEYNKAHRDKNWVWREYRRAMPKLNILSSSEPYGLVEADEVEHLKHELEQAKKGQNTELARLEKKLEQTRQEQLTLMKKMTELIEDSEKLKQ